MAPIFLISIILAIGLVAAIMISRLEAGTGSFADPPKPIDKKPHKATSQHQAGEETITVNPVITATDPENIHVTRKSPATDQADTLNRVNPNTDQASEETLRYLTRIEHNTRSTATGVWTLFWFFWTPFAFYYLFQLAAWLIEVEKAARETGAP
jgi:hypothetical protein